MFLNELGRIQRSDVLKFIKRKWTNIQYCMCTVSMLQGGGFICYTLKARSLNDNMSHQNRPHETSPVWLHLNSVCLQHGLSSRPYRLQVYLLGSTMTLTSLWEWLIWGQLLLLFVSRISVSLSSNAFYLTAYQCRLLSFESFKSAQRPSNICKES